MRITLSELKKITRGVERVSEEDGKFHFFRLTDEEYEVLRNITENPNYYKRGLGTAGVRLAFKTDASELSFAYECESEPARKYGFFDIYVNGEMVSHFGYRDREEFSGVLRIDLPTESEVEIYLPWSSKTVLFDIELKDATAVTPLFRKHTLVSYGDSITQGFDAEYPSLTFFSRLAKRASLDGINKGIGGYYFDPDFAACPVYKQPDVVTVAYGINDWTKFSAEDFYYNVNGFGHNYRPRHKKAGRAKSFLITPIRYLDPEKETPFGLPATALYDKINEVPYSHYFIVINGWDFLPEDKSLYADEILHPNDAGFEYYADAFLRETRLDTDFAWAPFDFDFELDNIEEFGKT